MGVLNTLTRSVRQRRMVRLQRACSLCILPWQAGALSGSIEHWSAARRLLSGPLLHRSRVVQAEGAPADGKPVMAKKSSTGAHRGLSGFTIPKRAFRPAYSNMDPTCAACSFCHLPCLCKQQAPMSCARGDMRGIYPDVSRDLLWELCCQNSRADLK